VKDPPSSSAFRVSRVVTPAYITEDAKGTEAAELSLDSPVIFVSMEFFKSFVLVRTVQQHKHLV
jgi:hypothetical protein